MDPVSVVIPTYNPGPALFEAVSSARRQTRPVEIILVNDGTDTAEGLAAIESVRPLVHRYIEQPNRGLPAARNAGFRAASGAYVAPFDGDDILEPRFAAECAAALDAHPEAAFVYADCRVFGRRNYIERYRDYNLFDLLHRNTQPYLALIRKEAWEAAGGYDESMRLGNEDWAFWLRLGGNGLYGLHLGKVLFRYRKAGPSLADVAARHEREAIAHMRDEHPELYGSEAYARVKAAWSPAACVVGNAAKPEILDCEAVEAGPPAEILRRARAHAFLIPGGAAHPQSAELAALAVWAGNGCVRLPDGSLAASRQALRGIRELSELRPDRAPDRSVPAAPPRIPSALGIIHRHLHNAGLLSAEAWLKHPARSALRLIPLRLKEEVNRRAGRAVFDLSFYLQFQPASILLGQRLLEPLRYLPPEPSRRRIALVTPHLGPGGAERVLLDIAAALRGDFEIFLIATQSSDSRWRPLWEEAADRVYDLAALAPPERVPGALYSILTNWKIGAALIQNSLPAYSIVRELKTALPGLKLADLVHSVDAEWDFVSSTSAVAGALDARVVISEAARARMMEAGTPEEKIRLIPNGLDLACFEPGALPPGPPHRILFAGRLDPVKRPLLLADIALALQALRPRADFRFVVAGDGPEAGALRARVDRAGLAKRFEFLGHVPDIAPLLAGAALLVLTSRAEGIPLVVLEAFASGRPVVASDAGAVREVVDASTGIVIPEGEERAAAFAKAIDALLNDPELRARMGQEGRRRVESRYAREQFCQAYRELFLAL